MMGNAWPQRVRPVPDDFAVWAGVEGIGKLKQRYGTSQSTIERWQRETGVRYTAPPIPKRVRAVSKVRRRIAQRMVAERIEDLEDFDADDLAACLGVRRYAGETY